MATIKQLRLRLKSIKSTKKITKAMQMVSASKLRKAKLALEASQYYHDVAYNILASAAFTSDELPDLAKVIIGLKEYSSTKLLFIFTSDRGLCGGFNNSILRLARVNIESYLANDAEVKLVAIGKKAISFVGVNYPELLLAEYNLSELSYDNILELTKMVLSKIEDKDVGSCELYFNIFENALTQVTNKKEIVPLNMEKLQKSSSSLYEIEGNDTILELIKIYITSEIHYALLQNKTSEEAARTTAMDNATRNAGDLIDKLTLVMNRTRQAAITKELIEIISGAEAV